MADNCYCSVQFQTGEELDEALMKAKTACDEAEKAVAARTAIENMQVAAEALEAGTAPTVTKTVEDGSVKLTFGLVPGKEGRGVSSVQVGSDGSLVITYTDNTSETISSEAFNALSSVREIPTVTFKVGENLLTDAMVTLGTGWSGSLATGFTHVSGYTNPLTFAIGSEDGDAYFIQGNCPNTGKTLIELSAGNSYPSDPYDGTTSIAWGVQSVGGGSLVITPKSDFSGTITNLSCKKITDDGTGEITVTLEDIGHSPSTNHISGMWNTQIGTAALENLVNGTRNVAIGARALRNLITGGRNIAIGTYALPVAKKAESNINIGADSGLLVESANNCIAIGKSSMHGGSNLNNNIAIGLEALYGAGEVASDVSSDNVAIGTCTGYKNNSKSNVFIGINAGYYNNTGNLNLFVGANAGKNNTSWGNTCIGASADIPGGYSQSVAIGRLATATKSNQVVLGGDHITETVTKGNLIVRGTDGVKREIVFNADGSCSWVEA